MLSTLLVDGLGSTLELADASGALQTHYTYEPFGATAVSGSASTNPIQYTGRENDGTDLYFYRARFYSSRSQRFITEDPIGLRVGSANLLYAYAMNRPTMLIDPLGLWPEIPQWLVDFWHIFWPAAGSAVAGAGGVAGGVAEAAMTLEEARHLQEKAAEIQRKKRESDDDIKRAICEQQDWPFCKDLPERKKAPKSNDPDKPDGSPGR